MEKPATSPAKPGSKLAAMQALGRRGGIRDDGGRPQSAVTVKADEGPGSVVAGDAPVPPTIVKRTPRKRVKGAVQKTKVTKAKAVLKRAEKQARGKRGPAKSVGEPWKAAGVSKAKYYRDRKGGASK